MCFPLKYSNNKHIVSSLFSHCVFFLCLSLYLISLYSPNTVDSLSSDSDKEYHFVFKLCNKLLRVMVDLKPPVDLVSQDQKISLLNYNNELLFNFCSWTCCSDKSSNFQWPTRIITSNQKLSNKSKVTGDCFYKLQRNQRKRKKSKQQHKHRWCYGRWIALDLMTVCWLVIRKSMMWAERME